MGRRKVASRMRRIGVGALPILAGLLMASGLVRLGDGTGNAILREIGAVSALAATAPAEQGDTPATDIGVILEALKTREGQLDAREERLAQRESRLSDLETRLRAQMDELAKAEADLSDLLKLAKTAADDDLTRLTSVYETMNPKDASALFSEMSPAFAAGFLGRMRSDAAAAIMAGLDPQLAYSISVMIAGRHAELDQKG